MQGANDPIRQAKPPLLGYSVLQQGNGALPIRQPLSQGSGQRKLAGQVVIRFAHGHTIATLGGGGQGALGVLGRLRLVAQQAVGTPKTKIIGAGQSGLLETLKALVLSLEQIETLGKAAQECPHLREMQY